MRKPILSVVMLGCGVLSLAIATYQLAGARIGWGILSIVYSVVFLIGGLATRRRRA